MCELLKSVDDCPPELKNADKVRRKFELFKSRYVSTLVLLDQRKHIEHLRAEGVLDSLDADPLVHTINKKIEHIDIEPILKGYGIPEFLRRKPKELEDILKGRGQLQTLMWDRVAHMKEELSQRRKEPHVDTASRRILTSVGTALAGVCSSSAPSAASSSAARHWHAAGMDIRFALTPTARGQHHSASGGNASAPEYVPSAGSEDGGSSSILERTVGRAAAMRRRSSRDEKWRANIDETVSRVRSMSSTVSQSDRLPDTDSPSSDGTTMIAALELFANAEWADLLRAIGSDCTELGHRIDMVLIGDFGRDTGDEKALAMAIAMRRIGLIGELSVVANLGDGKMRARLAKGTANILGAHDVQVAAGSDAGRTSSSSYEFDHAPYLAPEEELWGEAKHGVRAGHELVFSAMRAARDASVNLAIVLCSALTDMAAVLRDPRWELLAPGTVSHVVLMGGVIKNPNGSVRMDPESDNHSYDMASARYVYDALIEDLRLWFIIVSRFAASECQLPRGAFDGSTHLLAKRLTKSQRPLLKALWQRVNMTEVERLVTAEKMAMRNDVEGFRTTFLEPDAPATLSKDDDPWPYVRGFSEYDGLATVVAAMATHPQLFTKFFDPYNAPGSHTLVLGLNGSVHGIRDGKRVSDLLHYLMATAMGPGSGEWFGRMCDHEKPGVHHEGVATDMIMIGDFGRDQDDEKALIMAVVMRRIGLIGDLTVVTNLGDSLMRARLAKGTLNALGAHDVVVARGTDAGRKDEALHDFESCPYLAAESEIDLRSGHEIIFEHIRHAKDNGHYISIVLNSALTDMAALLRDPRWEQLAPDTVKNVVAMGGVVEAEDGEVAIDTSAANNSFDLGSARHVYETLIGDARFDFSVVTRHAAGVCQLPKKAFDGSTHPIALRLTSVAKPLLQALWVRTHRSLAERLAIRDGLPMTRDPDWFRKVFLNPEAPKWLGRDDDIWAHVRGFNEYDGLTTVVAATATFPKLFEAFFDPQRCPQFGTRVIGADPSKSGIRHPAKMSELLYDLLATAFNFSRFRKGFKIELRASPLSNHWAHAMLREPAQGQGADCWTAYVTEGPEIFSGAITSTPVFLNRATEGILWRIAHSLGDRDEPMHADLQLGMRYRHVAGVRVVPYFVTQACWNSLRRDFKPQKGDVWVTGYPGAGNMLVQMLVRTLLHNGDADAACAAPYACGLTAPVEQDFSRSKVDLPYLCSLPGSSRVFTTFHAPSNLPCAPGTTALPEEIKILHIVRDPRDACFSMFGQYLHLTKCDWETWANAYAEGTTMPYGGWLDQNLAWWDLHQANPEQVMWLTYEQCTGPRAAEVVKRVADFLDLTPSNNMVMEKTLEAIRFQAMRQRLEHHPKMRVGTSGQLKFFSQSQLELFEAKLLKGAREKGMVVSGLQL